MGKKKQEETSGFQEKLKLLEEKYGKNTLIKANEGKFVEVKETVNTGSISLDLATKINGIPKGGLITHVLGKESSSKTTLCFHVIANEQKKGNPCAFLDVEGTFSKDYFEACGGNSDLLYLIDKDELLKALGVKDRKAVSGEEWLDFLADLIKTEAFEIICLDSVATLTPMAELSTGIAGGGQIARMGAMMSRAMRTINANLIGTNIGLVLCNQYRISPGAYGNPFVEVSGEALKYYTSLKIELSKSLDKDQDGVYGIVVKGKITKSKVGNPFGEFEYYVQFGKGIVQDYEIINLAIEKEIIVKTGNTYAYNEAKLGVGIGQLETFLKDNPEVSAEIKEKVLEKLNNQ